MTQTTERVRVLIADGRRDVRDALVALLDASDEFEVVGQVATPREAADRAAALDPELLLVDPNGMHDIDALSRLASGSCPLVLLTLNISPECRTRARDLGVAAVVDKGTTPEELLRVLRRASHGSRPSPVRDAGAGE
jgi:DNA-binding NarL/FixJ family response regulator